MSNNWCAVCGHTNNPGAEVCEMCDSRLGDATTAGTRPHAYEDGSGTEPQASAAPPIRFKGAGDVILPMLELYRKNFLLVIAVVVISTVPPVLVQYGLMQFIRTAADSDSGLMANNSSNLILYGMSFTAVVWLLAIAGGALMSGALSYAVLNLQQGGAVSVGETLKRSLRMLPKLFLMDLMYMVVIGVGYVLLVVPGIIFSLMYALVIPIAVAEGLGPIESFKRSAELTKGYKGLIFLTFFLWGIGVVVLSLIINGSFSYGGNQNAFVVVVAQALVSGILNSTTAALIVYIYLGLLSERRSGFGTHVFTPEGGPAER